MKRTVLALLMVVVVASLIFAGCSAPAAPTTPAQVTPAPTSAPAPATTQPPATSAKTIELKLSYHFPPVSPSAKTYEVWADKVAEVTNGRVNVTIYPAASLVKGEDAYMSTAGGVCDIAYVANAYESSRLGLSQVFNQPALQFPVGVEGSEIWDEMWEKFPVMKDEYKGVITLWHYLGMQYNLHTKDEIRKPEDIKGMKIACTGTMVNILKEAGASAVGLPSNEWYMSLERGLVDGIFSPYVVMTDRGIEELLPYHLDLNMGQGGSNVIMNLDRWNSLPPDIQKAIDDLKPWITEDAIARTNDANTDGRQKCIDKGQTCIAPTDAEIEAWLVLAEPMAQDWIKDNADKGPTQEIYNYAKELIQKYK